MENGDSPVSKDHRGIPIFSVPAFSRASSRDSCATASWSSRTGAADALEGDRLTEPELSLAMNAGFADPL